MALGIAPCVPGLLASVGLVPPVGPLLAAVYDLGWFVGVAVATAAYAVGMSWRSGLQQQGEGVVLS